MKIKNVIRINVPLSLSVLGNLVLVAVAGYLWSERGGDVGRELSAADSHLAAASATPAPRLSWSQLESDNLLVFMDNLHAIGCPEATIRRIVAPGETGEGASGAFQEATPNGSSPAVAAPDAGQPAFQSLAGSGSGSSGNNAAAAPASPRIPAPESASSPPEPLVPLVPVAFQPVNFTDALPTIPGSGAPGSGLVLDEMQKAVIGQTQAQFVNQLSRTSRNPNDPVYAQQWTAAQQAADQMLRARLGGKLFGELQMSAARQALEQGR